MKRKKSYICGLGKNTAGIVRGEGCVNMIYRFLASRRRRNEKKRQRRNRLTLFYAAEGAEGRRVAQKCPNQLYKKISEASKRFFLPSAE